MSLQASVIYLVCFLTRLERISKSMWLSVFGRRWTNDLGCYCSDIFFFQISYDYNHCREKTLTAKQSSCRKHWNVLITMYRFDGNSKVIDHSFHYWSSLTVDRRGHDMTSICNRKRLSCNLFEVFTGGRFYQWCAAFKQILMCLLRGHCDTVWFSWSCAPKTLSFGVPWGLDGPKSADRVELSLSGRYKEKDARNGNCVVWYILGVVLWPIVVSITP